MSHSDYAELVLPPAIAPIHVVIVPIFKTDEDLEAITEYLFPVFEQFEAMQLHRNAAYLEDQQPLSYKIDDDDQKSP